MFTKPIEQGLRTRFSFLPFGYAREFWVRFKISSEQSRELLSNILTDIVPTAALSSELIYNMKGREAAESAAEEVQLHTPITIDEILFIEGRLEEDKSGDEDPTTEMPFSFRISSKFHGFDEKSRIIYQPTLERFGAIPDEIRLNELLTSVPIKLIGFRFGLNLFSSRFISSLFGMGPVITERLMIDCGQGQLALRLVDEGLNSRDKLPLLRDGLFEKLRGAFRKNFDFDLRESYKKT